MDIKQAANQLELALINSREFKELREAKSVIDRNPKSMDVLNQFQKKQELLYSGQVPQGQAQKYMDELDADYKKLSTIAEMKRYFQAGDSFNNLISNVLKDINSSIEYKLKK